MTYYYVLRTIRTTCYVPRTTYDVLLRTATYHYVPLRTTPYYTTYYYMRLRTILCHYVLYLLLT